MNQQLPFFTSQFICGWDDAMRDYARNTITDCPEAEGTGAAKSWWDGYHAYEEECVKKEQPT